jgi:hypothetical protein
MIVDCILYQKTNHENAKERKHEIINILFRVFNISCFRDKISFIVSPDRGDYEKFIA